jgi:predicted membrane metal-binding protein
MLIILNRSLFPVSLRFLLHLEYVYSNLINVSVMQIIVKTLSLIILFSLHKIFTKNFQISIALLLIPSSVHLKKIKPCIKY